MRRPLPLFILVAMPSNSSSWRDVSGKVEGPNSAAGVTTALKSFNLPLIDKCLYTSTCLNVLSLPHAALMRCANSVTDRR